MRKNIRNFNKSDWAKVRDIYLQTPHMSIAAFSEEETKYEDWDQHYLPFCRFVYEEDGNILGWAALSPISGRLIYKGAAELSIYIDKDNRNRGIGTSLLKRMIWESEAKGIWSLQSSISDDNEASLQLHRKCGFREIGYRERISKDSVGEWKNTVLMERRSGAETYQEPSADIL
jgi:phosphinothricin acetyltransferase